MKDNLSRYTLRVEQVLLDKLGYIAEYEGRTKNRELEQIHTQMEQADGYDAMLTVCLRYLREVMTCRMETYSALGRYYQMTAPEQRQWVVQSKEQMKEYFRQIAEQGRREGQMDPALSEEVCCDILISSLIGFAVACRARCMVLP